MSMDNYYPSASNAGPTSNYGAFPASNYGGGDTTFGAGPQGGSYVGSQIGQAGPPTVNVQDQEGYQEFVVRVPAPEVSQYIQGPAQYRTQVIPGQVLERVVQEVIPGPTQTVQEIIPGPITYRDEKVEVPGPVRERIERVEIPGPVYEHIEKEFIPGPEVIREVTVEVPGPVVEKIVNVDVAGPVIRRTVPGKQVEVPGPVRIVPRPVNVPREVIREVVVPRVVITKVPVPVMLPQPTRHILLKRFNKELLAENALLKRELYGLMSTRAPATPAAASMEYKFLGTKANPTASAVPVPVDQYMTQYTTQQAAPAMYDQAASAQMYSAAPQQMYAAPQQQMYAAPQQQMYAAPQQQMYGAPQQQMYAAPQQQMYGAPQQQMFGAPQQYGTYGGF